jgi:hypothetical protein
MAQSRLSPSNKVLSSALQAVCHLRFLLEGWTNRHAIHRVSEPLPPRQQRQLSFLVEFSANVGHIACQKNVMADALSGPSEPMPDVQTVAEATGVKAPSGVACHHNQHLSSSASSLEPLVEEVPLSWSLQSYWGLIVRSWPKTSWLAQKYGRCFPIPLLWSDAISVHGGRGVLRHFTWHCTLSGTFPSTLVSGSQEDPIFQARAAWDGRPHGDEVKELSTVCQGQDLAARAPHTRADTQLTPETGTRPCGPGRSPSCVGGGYCYLAAAGDSPTWGGQKLSLLKGVSTYDCINSF